MIETNLPEENDSQSISVLDSDDENGTSTYVTHSPRNVSNNRVSWPSMRRKICEKTREPEICGIDGNIRQYRHPTQGEPCHTKIEQIRFLVAVKTFNIHLGGENLVNQDY